MDKITRDGVTLKPGQVWFSCVDKPDGPMVRFVAAVDVERSLVLLVQFNDVFLIDRKMGCIEWCDVGVFMDAAGPDFEHTDNPNDDPSIVNAARDVWDKGLFGLSEGYGLGLGIARDALAEAFPSLLHERKPKTELTAALETIRVHDGDIIIYWVSEGCPLSMIRAFRRELAEHAERLGWGERGIFAQVMTRNACEVEIVRATSEKVTEIEARLAAAEDYIATLKYRFEVARKGLQGDD